MEQFPDLQSLALFVKVVEAGSFTKVTERFKIPKASLSRRISQLEAYYNVQLLVRNTRHVQLTEIGQDIFHKALTLLSLSDDVKATVSKTKQKPKGLLRITAGVEYGISVVSPWVSGFLKRFPEVNVELDLTGRRVDLIYENFDLGVRIGPLEDSTLSARKIGSFEYGLFASPQFLDRHPIVKVEDLAKVSTLAFSRLDGGKEWELCHRMHSKTIKIQSRMVSNNYWALAQSAGAGIGVVYMPRFLVNHELKTKRLVPVLSEWGSESIPIHLIYPSQKYLNSKVRSFIDYVVNQLN